MTTAEREKTQQVSQCYKASLGGSRIEEKQLPQMYSQTWSQHLNQLSIKILLKS